MNTTTSGVFSVELEEGDKSGDEGLARASSSASGPSCTRAASARTSQQLRRKAARMAASASQRRDLGLDVELGFGED